MKQRRSYFEGWYFKNQNEGEIISFIPAFHADEQGNMSASIQIIMQEESYQIFYSIKDFRVSGKRLAVSIGENKFTNQGIRLDIRTDKLTLSGKLYYTEFTPIKYDIMGPFQYVPFLQCRHRIYSMAHGIQGQLLVNDRKIDFRNGLGYVEGDMGTEFPSDYFWTQCSWSEQGRNAVMISAANVKIRNFTFPGCIGVVYYDGKEYRLATYLGVKIKKYNKTELWVQQGKYELQVQVLEKQENTLLAPVKGRMSRTVYESINSRIHYRFMIEGEVLFDYVGKGCFERGL